MSQDDIGAGHKSVNLAAFRHVTGFHSRLYLEEDGHLGICERRGKGCIMQAFCDFVQKFLLNSTAV